MEWEAQTGTCLCSTSAFENVCGCTALDMPKLKEMTEQIDCWAKQPSWLGSRKIFRIEKLETLPAGAKPRTSHNRSPGGEGRGKRKCSTIFLQRTRKGRRQSDEDWNCFKGNGGKIYER